MDEDALTPENWKWVKKDGGWIVGVFQGLGESYGFNPNILRGLLIFSVLFFGSGIILYLVLAFIMPKEAALSHYNRPQLAGTCYHLSLRSGIELPVIRIAMVLGVLFSLGLFVVIYFALAVFYYFDLKNEE